MFHRLTTLALLLLILAGCASSRIVALPPALPSDAQFFQSGVILLAFQRHVEITDEKARCTGVIVGTNRVLTAAHCWVDPKDTPLVAGKRSKLVSIWIEADLLLLEAKTGTFLPIRIAASRPGQRVFAACQTGPARESDVTFGQVLGDSPQNGERIYATVSMRGGMSGSGLYDESGSLVGMLAQIERRLTPRGVVPFAGIAVGPEKLRAFLTAAHSITE